MDTRDPMGGGHGYTTNIFGLLGEVKPGDQIALEKLRAVGKHLYGSSASVDPFSGYEGKAEPAAFHHDRAAIKDSLGICDNIFPMLTDPKSDDFLMHVNGIEGQDLEYYLFQPASDLEISREAFYRIGARIFTAERMLAIRNWGRSRATDETIIPYLERPEGSTSPYLQERITLDPQRFRMLLSEYYALRGWDPQTGRPSEACLRALDMDEFLLPLGSSLAHSFGREARNKK